MLEFSGTAHMDKAIWHIVSSFSSTAHFSVKKYAHCAVFSPLSNELQIRIRSGTPDEIHRCESMEFYRILAKKWMCWTRLRPVVWYSFFWGFQQNCIDSRRCILAFLCGFRWFIGHLKEEKKLHKVHKFFSWKACSRTETRDNVQYYVPSRLGRG